MRRSSLDKSRGPLVVALLILLMPIAYVAGYFALVVPGGIAEYEYYCRFEKINKIEYRSYRIRSSWVESVYGRLERIDRQLRPESWQRDSEQERLDLLWYYWH